MANFKRKKTKRHVLCSICTPHRWRGNNTGRFKEKDEAKKKEDKKELANYRGTSYNLNINLGCVMHSYRHGEYDLNHFNGYKVFDASFTESIVDAFSMSIESIDSIFLSLTHPNGVDVFSVRITDEASYCCEHRYMTTDDDITHIIGGVIRKMEIVDADDISDDEYGVHQIQFFNIETDIGSVQFATHNENNGYYNGFDVVIRDLNK